MRVAVSHKGRVMGVFPTWLQPAWLQQTWLQPGRDFDLSNVWRRERLPQAGMDLGNGRVLPPEDVLEGHYRRLAAQRAAATRQVSVQVGDNLTVAITVLAPDLVPLTRVAERVSDAVPRVEPAPQFRAHLHEALERTHRQHAVERALGMRAQPQQASSPVNWWMVLAGLAATLALWWGWRMQQRDAPAT
jgi:hypothetical protein